MLHDEPTRLTTYQTSPKAPIPTGCKSVYLEVANISNRIWQDPTLRFREGGAPACDLESCAEDLGPYEFRHDEKLVMLKKDRF